MREIFKNISDEKRDLIINSAMKEFTVNSFEKASTNNIIKEAGISKGALYHYFSTKQELYDMLVKFSMEYPIEKVLEALDWGITDFFKRIEQITIAKINIMNEYPYIYDFMMATRENISTKDTVEKVEKISPNLYYRVYNENIDFSLFKEGLDMQKVIHIIQSSFEKYGEQQIMIAKSTGQPLDFRKFAEDFKGYSDILKDAFYK